MENRFIKCLLQLLLIWLSSSSLSAQGLCDGNLGVNIFEDGDFGSGPENVVPVNPMIAPGYTYKSDAGSPNDGFYTITNGTQNWSFWFPTWLRLSDNSDDPEGYFMLVNADFNPGKFYEQNIDGLCENTLYQFSADIINVVRSSIGDHILPNVSFLIDEVVQFSSGDIPQDEKWNTYGFTFTTAPGQTSVKLSLRNNAPGGNGNDLALDNISFQACGPDAFVTAEQTIFLCEDDNTPVEVRAEIGAANQSLQWQISYDSISWQDLGGQMTEFVVHNIFDIGRYYYRYITAGTDTELINEKCRIISDVLVIEILAINYPDERDTICFGETLDFGNQVLSTSGSYNYTFTSSRGCDSIVDLELLVLDEEILQLDTSTVAPSCFGFSDGSIEIDIVNGLYGPYSYGINEVLTTINTFEGLEAGNYQLTIANSIGCSQTVVISLDEPEEFIIALPSDTIIKLGESLDINVMTNQSLNNLEWDPPETSPCGLCTEFSFLPLSSETYTVTGYNSSGCTTQASMNITIDIDDLEIYLPTAFFPGSSSVDDSFTIGAKEGLITSIKEFSVYDRWGNLIHSSTNSSSLELWDGRINNTRAMPGVYVYNLEIELIDGNTYRFTDDLLLLR